MKFIESVIEMEGRRTIAHINETSIDATDASNDVKFIRETGWTKEDLIRESRNYIKGIVKHSHTEFLIIDDSTLEKAGRPKHMEGLGWHYSHSKGKAVYSHSIVNSHYRYGDISFPYDFDMYRTKSESQKSKNDFRTKIEIAVELIENFEPFSDEKV